MQKSEVYYTNENETWTNDPDITATSTSTLVPKLLHRQSEYVCTKRKIDLRYIIKRIYNILYGV